MGDPKKLRKKYSSPIHPWVKSTIDEERIIKKEYGLRNKKEIFIADSFLKKYKNLAKKLIANSTVQGEKEKVQIVEKLQRLGLLSVGSGLNDILNLHLKDILERRIQSVVFRKGLARSMNQARQFVVHRHVTIGNKEITFPSYIISLEEESQLSFKGKSSLADEEHPERVDLTKKVPESPESPKAEVKKEAPEVKKTKAEKTVKETPGTVKEEVKTETPKEEPNEEQEE